MAGFPFDSNNLNQLGDFQLKWRSSSYKFNDPKIEQKKTSLVQAIGHYLQSISLHTVPTETPGWLSVPQDLELTNQQKFRITVDDLYTKADIVTRLYDELISIGRKKYG